MADPYQTRLPEQLASEVDELVDKHGLTTAEAMRQLVRRGVEDRQQQSNQGGGSGSPQQTGQFVGWALLSASIATFALGSTTPAGAVAAAAAIVFLGTAIDQYRGGADGN